MRSHLFTLTIAVALAVVLLRVDVHGANPVGSFTRTQGSWNQTVVGLSIWDGDVSTGTLVPVHLYVDGVFFDAINVPTTYPGNPPPYQYYAPFGIGTHTMTAYVNDVGPGGVPSGTWVSFGTVSWTDYCSGLGGAANYWCNSGQGHIYYANRQSWTQPLMNDNVWVGVNTGGGGGAIQQFYSRNRSYNLLNESPGAAVQLSMWGYVPSSQMPTYTGQSDWCSSGFMWDTPQPPTQPVSPYWRLVNPMQTPGANCQWNPPAIPWWPLSNGLEAYLQSPYLHNRMGQLTNYKMLTNVMLGSDHIRIAYTVQNDTGIYLEAADQEIPAIYLNDNISNMAWSSGGTGAHAAGAPWSARLRSGVSPTYPSDPPTTEQISGWNGSWVRGCDSTQTTCVTAAPGVAPSAGGINMVYMTSNTIDPDGNQKNQITLLGRFTLAPGESKHWWVYLFPSWPGEARIAQVRGW